ncbi:MAG: RNA 3'-terminal phosphate cyclase [Armatimonadota bacterium]|nr:RNA 3'-terminal phosphate cyclase [Armatimonadota bacterium]
MLHIDGSQRSGSGTVVRTAAVLATLLGRDISLTNIRARRQMSGLRPQHLKAVEALAAMTGATLAGAGVGSSWLQVRRARAIRAGAYRWDIGSAGSTTLLAMTVLPLALYADGSSRFRMTGGLFADFAPSAFHLRHVVLPTLYRMGVRADVEIVRPGYAPKGGGVLELTVRPVGARLSALVLGEQGRVVRVWGVALSSHLEDRRVSHRMADRCRRRLADAGLDADIEVVYDRSAGQPGAALAVFAETDTGCLLGADRAGAPGRRSETIADSVATMLLEDLGARATVDRHLADQLILYAALAEGTSTYVVPAVTEHVDTNCWLVESLLGAGIEWQDRVLRIHGVGFERSRAERVVRS